MPLEKYHIVRIWQGTYACDDHKRRCVYQLRSWDELQSRNKWCGLCIGVCLDVHTWPGAHAGYDNQQWRVHGTFRMIVEKCIES